MEKNATKLPDGRIVHSEEPLNVEMPFETVDTFVTPTESFYVRTHFPIPKIDRDAWWLHVEGEVEKPFAINYEELVELESRTIPVTLECAGNNRDFLEPKVKGVQWGLGAVGTAEWTGVPLSVLLDRAVVRSNAREVILEGADCGMLEDPKSPPGELRFSRSIPLEQGAARRVARLQNEWQATFRQNMDFLFAPLCPAGTRWRRSNGCSALLSADKPFTGYYQTWITHTGKGEGTLRTHSRSPKCKLRRKSRSQLKAKPSLQILMCASMARLGRATAKSQRSSLAPMADPLGTRQICLVNRNQTPGDFGNSIGKRPAYRESKLS